MVEETRQCKVCTRTRPVAEFAGEEGQDFATCYACRKKHREYGLRARLKARALRDGYEDTNGRVVADPEVLAALELAGEGARASWVELAGCPGGFQTIPARRRPRDNGRRWRQIR